MNKEEIKGYCCQEFVPTPENPCEIQTKNIVGKNLLEGKYFDGNDIPKMIGITKNEFLEYRQLQQENKQLKEVINKIESLIKSKGNDTCIHNNERRGAYTFVLNFDEAREFVWNLEDILKDVS